MLKAGERVQLITQLAERLDEMDYAQIDLHLRQFGFPWTDDWTGTKGNYALNMLEQGNDVALLALHEHLFGFSGAPANEDADFWPAGSFRLFLSHVSANKIVVSELRDKLLDYGIAGFVAHEDIAPSREWVDEIEKALLTCEALVAVLSEGFKESSWTDQEVGFCHGRRVLIISVRDGLDPYGFISKYQAINGQRKSAAETARAIYRILVQHPKTSAAMASALVTLFEASDSFAEAKRRVGLLGDIVNWTPDLLRRIEEAVRTNSQIEDAWGVLGQVDRILKENRGAGFTPRPAPPPPSPFEIDDDELPF